MLSYVNPGPSPLAQLMCLAHGDTSSQPPPPSPWTLARFTPSCLKSIHTPAQQVSLSPGVAQLSQSSETSQKEKSHLASSTCEHHASLATLFPT